LEKNVDARWSATQLLQVGRVNYSELLFKGRRILYFLKADQHHSNYLNNFKISVHTQSVFNILALMSLVKSD